jgi:hypothetical protein
MTTAKNQDPSKPADRTARAAKAAETVPTSAAAAEPAAETPAGPAGAKTEKAGKTESAATSGKAEKAEKATAATAAAASPKTGPSVTIPLDSGLVDVAVKAVTFPVTTAMKVAQNRNGLPAYLAVGGLVVVGVVEWPVAAATGLGLAALRRWGPLKPTRTEQPAE